jgi:lysophospholipase L1-like esterase
MGWLVRIPAVGLGALGVLAVASAAAQAPWMARRPRLCAAGVVLAGVGTLFAAFGFWTVRGGILSSNYFSLLAWLVTLAILPLGRAVPGAHLQSAWKALGLLWAFCGGFVWLAESYFRNVPAEFYLGLAINLFLLLLCKRIFRLPSLLVQAVNTAILLLIAVPLLDLTLRWLPHSTRQVEPRQQLYLYRNAEKDPAGFAQWCAKFDAAWSRVYKDIFLPDPAGIVQPRLKPGSHTRFFDSPIAINRLGFRGREIAWEKGNTYRIVALGESTTFGFTLQEADLPWPDLLEQLIRERLHPHRPVEVINAGMPDWDLQANLGRLPTQILPLHPDMIISYHGYNGFSMIHGVVPLSNHLDPPLHRRRPLKLLADCEYRLQVLRAVKREQTLLATRASSFVNPLQTEYARAYRQLIGCAQTNHIRLVLANYSLAVNDTSPQPVLDFYRGRYPSLVWWIKANQVHTVTVRELAQQHPDVRWVDTHPSLDGDHDKFIDLIHFTQDGRRQLAESLFAGIKDLLAHDLAAPPHSNDPATEHPR